MRDTRLVLEPGDGDGGGGGEGLVRGHAFALEYSAWRNRDYEMQVFFFPYCVLRGFNFSISLVEIQLRRNFKTALMLEVRPGSVCPDYQPIILCRGV